MKYIIATLALVLTACSVREAKVVNQPPVIPAERKVQMTSLHGNFTFENITMFYWPKWSEQEALEKANAVKKLSLEADAKELSFPKHEAALGKAVIALTENGCDKFMTNAGDVVGGVTPAAWIEAVPEADKSQFDKCRAIEGERLTVLVASGADYQRYLTVSSEIAAIVDPQMTGEFWKTVPVSGATFFSILPSEDGKTQPKVIIRMRGLLNDRTRIETVIDPAKREQNRPATGALTEEETAAEKKKLIFLQVFDVKYDTRMHSLSFKVSGNTEWGVTETHEFSLVRYDELNYNGSTRTRFGGDVVLKKDGKVVSKGSIMIRGVFKPAE